MIQTTNMITKSKDVNEILEFIERKGLIEILTIENDGVNIRLGVDCLLVNEGAEEPIEEVYIRGEEQN